MAFQQATSSHQLMTRPSASTLQGKSAFQDENDDARPMASFMPQEGSLDDLLSLRVWRSHVMWRAGASVLKSECIFADQRICF